MKQLLKYVISMILVIGVFTPFTFTKIKATETIIINVPFEKPETSDEKGYLEVLTERNGNYYVHVFCWYLMPTNIEYNDHSAMDITIIGNIIRFTAFSFAGDNYFNMYRLYKLDHSSYDQLTSEQFSGVEYIEYDILSRYNYNIVGARVYGNYGMYSYDMTTNNQDFIINYGTDSIIVDELKENNSLLQNIKDLVQSLKDMFSQENKENVETNANEFTDKSNQLNNIESGLVTDFENSFEQIELKNDLFKGNDFIKTSTFISTQMSNIYNSNANIKNLITYSMIIGLAMTVIGIKLGR